MAASERAWSRAWQVLTSNNRPDGMPLIPETVHVEFIAQALDAFAEEARREEREAILMEIDREAEEWIQPGQILYEITKLVRARIRARGAEDG